MITIGEVEWVIGELETIEQNDPEIVNRLDQFIKKALYLEMKQILERLLAKLKEESCGPTLVHFVPFQSGMLEPAMANTFDDSKPTWLPAILTNSDGSFSVADASTFQLTTDTSGASISAATVASDTPIPGTSLVLKAGSSCYQLAPTAAVEDVDCIPAGFPSTVTNVADFTVSEAAPPVVPTAVNFAPFQ